MNSLIIKSTAVTPEVNFDIDNNTLTFLKVSKPENPREFYKPLYDFIDQFEKEKVKSKQIDKLSIDFKFQYFNTASVKILYELLEKVKKIQSHGIELIINWFYDSDDEDMLEEGEIMSEALNLPFNFHAIEMDDFLS